MKFINVITNYPWYIENGSTWKFLSYDLCSFHSVSDLITCWATQWPCRLQWPWTCWGLLGARVQVEGGERAVGWQVGCTKYWQYNFPCYKYCLHDSHTLACPPYRPHTLSRCPPLWWRILPKRSRRRKMSWWVVVLFVGECQYARMVGLHSVAAAALGSNMLARYGMSVNLVFWLW